MKIIDPAYFCFMAEAEGLDTLVTTRTAKINAAINEFIALARQNININDYIDSILKKHGLSENELTQKEINFIMNSVNAKI